MAKLTASGLPEAANHNSMYRPWGFYESLIQGDRFQVKRMHVDPGHKLSLQKHFHRAEHWGVVAGTAVVTYVKEQLWSVKTRVSTCPLGYVQRLENPDKILLTLSEVQSGPCLGADDSVRIDDIYARV